MSDNIPAKESTHKGIPVTDVESAQKALLDSMRASKEQPEEVVEETTPQEEVVEQAKENAESVETQAEDAPTGELTVDDLVEDNQNVTNETPQNYTVKVDGKDVEVTLEELQAGYSRQADYTRKSQVLAEQRKQMEEELNATQQERQRYSSQLEQFTKDADSKLDEFKSVDWTKLKEDDPMEYALKRDQYRELQESKRMVEEEQQNLADKQQTEMQQKWQEELTRQQEIMAQRLPEFVDPDKGPKLKQAIKTFAMNKGFTEQEVNSLIDARSVDVLHKAMLYENLLEAKISKKKEKVVPKVTKPGTSTPKAEIDSEKVKQQRSRLKRSGKVDDAAALIKSML
tara:strand:+ start:316 stop:1341 length:1026 start_codon:yes stop_codon:yes gene_type:complete